MITKQQFKNYIQYFDFSFKKSIENNFYLLNEINDISGINHSLNEINTFQKNKYLKLFYSKDFSIITTNNISNNLNYFIFVKIGKLLDNSIIGSIYFIYDYIENQIFKNEGKDISFLNYCINNLDLNKMLKF